MADSSMLFIPEEYEELPSPSSILKERENNKRAIESLSVQHTLPTLVDIKDDEARCLLKQAEKLEMKQKTIQHTFPGMDIVSQNQMFCLFSCGALSVSKFNLDASMNMRDDVWQCPTAVMYMEVMAEMDEYRKTMKEVIVPFSHYLFFLMSIHEDTRMVDACMHHLTHFNEFFHPTFDDILAVFINWGCDLNVLCPESSDFHFEVPEPIRDLPSKDLKIFDLHYNIETILQYLSGWNSCISEMKLLIRVLLLSALDKRFFKTVLSLNFVECIHALMNRNNWPAEEVIPLAKLLHFKDSHFHNQAQASMYMEGRSEVASQVATSLAYASLQQHLLQDIIIYVQEVDMQTLSKLVQKMPNTKTAYEIYVIIKLLCYCMKNIKFEEGDMEHMKRLTDWLKTLEQRMATTISALDSAHLSELIGRVTSTWSILYGHHNTSTCTKTLLDDDDLYDD